VQDQELAKCAAKWQADICYVKNYSSLMYVTSCWSKIYTRVWRQMEVIRIKVTKLLYI